MTDLQLTTALETIAAAMLCSFVFFRLLPIYRVDVFRQSMFALRDELFDYALAGKISFNDPAYVLLRTLMNGFIRYGHQLTSFRVLMSNVLRKINGGTPHLKWNERWENATGKVDALEVREQMLSFHNRTVWLVAKHLILGSPTLMVAMIVVGLVLAVNQGITSMRQLVREARNKLITMFDPRFLEEEAVCARLRI